MIHSLRFFRRLPLARRLAILSIVIVLLPGDAGSLQLQAGSTAQPDPVQKSEQKKELARHQGVWVAGSFRREGQETPKEIVGTITRTVNGDHVVWKRAGKSFAGTDMVLDPSRNPKTIDVIADGGPSRGKRVRGIYRLEGDQLTLCTGDPDQPRPSEFQAEKGSGQTLMIFTREQPSAAK